MARTQLDRALGRLGSPCSPRVGDLGAHWALMCQHVCSHIHLQSKLLGQA